MKSLFQQARIGVMAVSAFLVLGCQFGVGSRSSWPPDDATASPVVPSPSTTARAMPTAPNTEAPEAANGCGSRSVWVDYLPHSLATLADYGWHFAVAEVTGFEPAFFNTEDGRRPSTFQDDGTHGESTWDPRAYSPINVEIQEAVRGPYQPGSNRFLIEGGTFGCYTVRVDTAPTVEVGSRYVFVLTDARDASREDVLPLREAKFAWSVDAAGIVATPDGPKSIDELRNIISRSEPSPLPSADPDPTGVNQSPAPND